MQPVDDIALFFKDGQGALLSGSVTAVAAAGASPAKAARPPQKGQGKGTTATAQIGWHWRCLHKPAQSDWSFRLPTVWGQGTVWVLPSADPSKPRGWT